MSGNWWRTSPSGLKCAKRKQSLQNRALCSHNMSGVPRKLTPPLRSGCRKLWKNLLHLSESRPAVTLFPPTHRKKRSGKNRLCRRKTQPRYRQYPSWMSCRPLICLRRSRLFRKTAAAFATVSSMGKMLYCFARIPGRRRGSTTTAHAGSTPYSKVRSVKRSPLQGST